MTTKRFTLFAIVMAAFALLVGCKKEKMENYSYKEIKASSITENMSIIIGQNGIITQILV